ncbi:MAG: L,D-transpeptidase [Candidatus Lernaella stagnicola]|nr:L,D-transpeptidase [Candidatus Lernaella stagnicola]
MKTNPAGLIMLLALLVGAAFTSVAPAEDDTTPTPTPQVVRAKVVTDHLKKDPPIDRSAGRVKMEGERQAPQWVQIPIHQPHWRDRMTQLGIAKNAPRRMVVSKRRHLLQLVAGDQVVGEYPVGFGRNYLNDKLEQGDKTSPEGVFRVVHKHPSKKTHRSLCLDYPNAQTHRKRARARQLGVKFTREAGSDICIHGHGVWGGETFYEKGGVYYVKNWTRGCLTINDDLMEEVYAFGHTGMRVEISW